jgi:glycosyltransferase involved in cell wall biosynthesis
LKVLTEIYPEAPIYTAFRVRGSHADEIFSDREIHESFLAFILKIWRLYSPLRFLIPLVWWSFDLSGYDLVITSSSNYIARGFRVGGKTRVVCYCHTPPRFLYGFKTGYDWKKNIFIRAYGELIRRFLVIYDKAAASRIDYWIANSENVRERIKKFYGKEAVVIYPPVDVPANFDNFLFRGPRRNGSASYKFFGNSPYFLVVARLVGSKGLFETVKAANELNINLKIVGSADGFTSVSDKLKKIGGKNVEFLGRVEDNDLWRLYANAKGFIALARDEDFGMTVVEAQAFGIPVIAFNGGGFRESVIDGKTGVFVSNTDIDTLREAFQKFEKIRWNKKVIRDNAKRFSKENFIKNFKSFVNSVV